MQRLTTLVSPVHPGIAQFGWPFARARQTTGIGVTEAQSSLSEFMRCMRMIASRSRLEMIVLPTADVGSLEEGCAYAPGRPGRIRRTPLDQVVARLRSESPALSYVA